MKGYEMILQDNHHIMLFALGNIIAFVVALIAVKTFIAFLTKYGFKVWGWYRIIIGVVLLIYFWNQPQKENVTEIPQADITFNPTKE